LGLKYIIPNIITNNILVLGGNGKKTFQVIDIFMNFVTASL